VRKLMRAALDKHRLKTVYDRAAGHYDLQHSLVTAGADQRGRKLVVTETVKTGDRVLDCGAGTGSTALLAAGATGPTGHIVLFDMSDGMLAIAKKRVIDNKTGARFDFQAGDMLALPFADNSFDCVLSTYSMCPLFDPAKGALELYRVVRAGGCIGVAHSVEPRQPCVKWLADKVENVVWRLPSISLGCRSVSVLPTLKQAGCSIIFRRYIGVPLWPFLVFVAKKPTR